jgi:prepilin-type N-terminal cleavage/methylation domain-containing protein
MYDLIARARTRLARQDGFTLIELMVAITIGMVVLTAVLNLLDSSVHAGARIEDKTETVQRMRIAMDRVSRVLRTQVCSDSSTPPVISGDDQQVTFYSDKSEDTTFAPRKVQLSFANGTITERTWFPTTSSAPWGYPSAPDRTESLVDNATTIGGGPMFTYYSWTDLTTPVATPLDTSLSSTPLPDNSIAKVVRVDVGFQALAVSGRPYAGGKTAMTNSIYVRNADFSGASDAGRTWGPRCG